MRLLTVEGLLRSQEAEVVGRNDDALCANLAIYLGFMYIYRYIRVRVLGMFLIESLRHVWKFYVSLVI